MKNETVEPNPYSPFATADPNYRHIIPSPIFFPAAKPGVLVLTGCNELAVVPEELSDVNDSNGILQDGLCPACVSAMNSGEEPAYTGSETSCGVCQSPTHRDGLCVLCRQSQHDEWWPTRNGAIISAPDIESVGTPLSEMSDGHVIEIEKQSGPLHPGFWMVERIVNEGRTAWVRRLTDQELESRRSGEPFSRIYE